MPTRTLIVTRLYPRSAGRAVSGAHQRFSVFLEAIAAESEIDLLVYPPADAPVGTDEVERRRKAMSERLNTEVRITVCARRDSDQLNRWRRFGAGALDFFSQATAYEVAGPEQTRAFERRLDEQPERILVHRLECMAPVLRTNRLLPPVILDLDDIEHVRAYRMLRHGEPNLKSRLRAAHLPAMMLAEWRATRAAARTFVCSPADKRYLESLHHRNVAVVPNTTAIAEPTALCPDATFAFIGTFWYPPNADAASFLLNDVWPRIIAELPRAELLLVGPSPEAVPEYASRRSFSRVVFTDFVPDLDEVYSRTRVVLAPIRSGGGTRIKILEAAARGKPVVATTLGAEGLALRDGIEILKRDRAEQIARACIELAVDDDRCVDLGQAARIRVAERYGRQRVIAAARGQIFAATAPSNRSSSL